MIRKMIIRENYILSIFENSRLDSWWRKSGGNATGILGGNPEKLMFL